MSQSEAARIGILAKFSLLERACCTGKIGKTVPWCLAEAPELADRTQLLQDLLPKSLLLAPSAVESAALRTAGLLPADLSALAADAAAHCVAKRVDLEDLMDSKRNSQGQP